MAAMNTIPMPISGKGFYNLPKIGFNDSMASLSQRQASDTGDSLSFSAQLMRKIFDSLSAHIAIIDRDGLILETNAAWKRFSVDGGLPVEIDFRRMNYLHICEAAQGEGDEDARQVAAGIRRVIDGEISEFLYDYPCHCPEGPRWFYMRAIPMADTGPIRVIVSHEDITELKLAQESLQEQQKELEDKNQSLEEANIALKVLLRHRESDKAELEKRFLSNVKTFVLPYIQKLKASNLGEKDRTLVTIAEDHLNDLLSPMLQQFANADILLTPQETQVAALVKDGKTTSEIADILFVSEATVSFHRKNLRTKLGLKNRQTNLRSFLLSMS